MSRQNSSRNGSIKMTDCIIIAGADMNVSAYSADDFKDRFIICADRGVSHAKALGIAPDLIVGDFDSLGYVPQADCDVLKFRPEKDDTDLMIALKQALQRGFKDISIYAALGGRLDHTFAAVQSLGYALENGAKARLISNDNTTELLDAGTYTFEQKDGFSLSLFSFGEKVSGLCIKGTKYDAENISLNSSFPLGVSNEITADKAVISFESGRLLVITSRL